MPTIDPFTTEGAKRIAALTGQQPAPVSASVLSAPTVPTLPQPAYTPPPTTPSIPTFGEIFDTPETPTEQAFRDTTIRSANTAADLAGENAFRTEQEGTVDLTGKKKTVNDLTTSFNNLKAEYDQIPLQIQQDFAGRGATAGGVAPIQTGLLRNNAIRQLGVSAMLNAANGNLASAQGQVEAAVKAKFDPLKAQLAAQQAQILALTPLFNAEEKKRAEKQTALLDERKRALDAQEKEQTNIGSVMLVAAQYGADASTLSRIQNATSYQDAIAQAGSSLQDPKAQYQLESARLDNILKQAQIDQTRKETSLIGQPSPADAEKQQQAQQAAKDAITTTTDAINNINSLLTHPGMAGTVGAYGITRFTPLTPDKAAKQEFLGKVQQLISRQTLDTLINLKAAGGTLGALSDSERSMLENAASAIGYWAIKDKNGKVTGYEIDEESFKRELNTILTLAQRARDRAVGAAGLVTTDERAALQSFLSTSTGGSTAPTNFIPSSYFQ